MEEVYVSRVQYLVEYLNLHIMSLNQDLEQLSARMDSIDPASKEFEELDIEYNFTSGQESATQHILSVVEDTMVTWKH